KTSKVEKEFYLRCSYLTLSVLFDKEPKKSGSKLKTVSIRFFLSKLVTTSSYTLIRMISSKIYLV
ncbi:hypothetical protein FZM69_11480, partial [Enterococcus faecium]|nr:hypothetical protein [Enterococcus faecium]